MTPPEREPTGFTPDPKPRRFDWPVAPGGYAWWYVDVISDDHRLGLTIIIFVGSVFSPHYFAARRRASARGEAPPDPTRHSAVNVALYQPGAPALLDRGRNKRAWALSEYPSAQRERARLGVGASTIAWTEDEHGPLLQVEIDEREPFLGRRPIFAHAIRGRVRLRPAAIFGPRIELDPWREQPRHRWYPVAPMGRAEVEFEAPALRFEGSAYHDVNEGDEALEAGFRSWSWARAELGEHAGILYDVVDPRGGLHPRGWRLFPSTRTLAPIADGELGAASELPRSFWGMHRPIRVRPGEQPQLIETLEDSPFYTRNLVHAAIGARPPETETATETLSTVTMHESVDLERFRASSTQFLLPFRTRRG
ncbi:carotenoid 1,2-hydratase [Pseudenhygromyxa sp. WMMC2535]|uniref:carotenoid 1,2-hydratase n=1 Tax=Pseudenhygromyxa sp. WMMC2535 TaxID=2712867 RepID=UPI001552B772|nr:carotenoid 1,2-hydratase [Pseudenhygromyxa sp. WMMC2535]NVB38053.1 carotenoid 1,2-hydratase [Pseudenhygromyxa sp. WMMC2535]